MIVRPLALVLFATVSFGTVAQVQGGNAWRAPAAGGHGDNAWRAPVAGGHGGNAFRRANAASAGGNTLRCGVTDLPAFESFIAGKPTPLEFRTAYSCVTLALPGDVTTREFRADNSRYIADLDVYGRIVGGSFQ